MDKIFDEFDITSLKTLGDYYTYMDTLECNSIDLHYFLDKIKPLLDSLDEEEKQKLQLEVDCLNFSIKEGEITPLWKKESNDGKIIYQYPDLNSVSEKDLDYLLQRTSAVRNSYLKSRFNHILWNRQRDINCAKGAINAYFDLINVCKKLDTEQPHNHHGIEIAYAFGNLQDLAFSISYKIDEVKSLALDIAFNANEKSSCFFKLRLDVIEFLAKQCQKKKFELKILDGLDLICEEMADKNNGLIFTTSFLNAGTKISLLKKESIEKWDLKQAQYYEKLMNETGSLEAPAYCQKAIDFYKKIKNTQKINELSEKYTFLANSIKLGEYTAPPIDLTIYINEYKKMAEELDSENIIQFLMHSSHNVPNYKQTRESVEKISKNSLLSMLCSTQIIDKFGHAVKYLSNDEDNIIHELWRNYEIQFNIQSEFLFRFIYRSTELNKLNAEILNKFLEEKTWYGIELEKKLVSNQVLKYRWIDHIKGSISTAFEKMEKYIKKEPVELIFIQEIDSLSLKIEGIVRDLIDLAEIDSLFSYRFCPDKNGNKIFEWKNLNNYLYDEKIFELIPEDDVWFMRYFLVDSMNVRNNSAHCLRHHPNEYNIFILEYLIIILLRLARFKITPTKD